MKLFFLNYPHFAKHKANIEISGMELIFETLDRLTSLNVRLKTLL